MYTSPEAPKHIVFVYDVHTVHVPGHNTVRPIVPGARRSPRAGGWFSRPGGQDLGGRANRRNRRSNRVTSSRTITHSSTRHHQRTAACTAVPMAASAASSAARSTKPTGRPDRSAAVSSPKRYRRARTMAAAIAADSARTCSVPRASSR